MTFNLIQLKLERVKRNLKQADVAKAIGIATSTYSKKEKGIISITVEELQQLCDFYGESPENFFVISVDKKQH